MGWRSVRAVAALSKGILGRDMLFVISCITADGKVVEGALSIDFPWIGLVVMPRLVLATGLPCLLLFLLAAEPVPVAAQNLNLPWRVGLAVHGGLNVHQADFRQLPGFPISEKATPFTSGSGLGYSIAARADYLLFPGIRGGLQADFRVLNGVLRAQEGPFPVAGSDTVIDLTLEHAIDASLASLGVELSVSADIIDRLSVRAGLRAGRLLTASFTQTEKIVDPPGLTYVSGGSERTIFANTSLPDVPAIELSTSVSLGIDIPVARQLMLHPEVTARLGLTDIVGATKWKASTIQAGIACMWQPVREKPVVVDTVYKRDTTVKVIADLEKEDIQLLDENIQTDRRENEEVIYYTVLVEQSYVRRVMRPVPVLTADMNVRFVLGNGVETEGARITIEKLLEKKYIPLLPYIFFDSMSAAISSRYQRIPREETNLFSLSELKGRDMLPVYYDVLNIIGKRMKSKPGAILTITGTNADEGGEKKNIELSRARAETIRDYLIGVWDIDAWRLSVRAVNLPARPSNSLLTGGNEENRRVELFSDDPDILAPVYLQDTVRIATPPVIRFYPRVVSEAGVDFWDIRILQNERILKTFREEGDVPSYMDWNIGNDRVVLVSADAPMQYMLTVHDFAGQTLKSGTGTMSFQIRDQVSETGESGHLQQYSLIVFDYDGAGLSASHRKAIASIRSTLSTSADISVIGMTDILGDEEYNRQLSTRRAQAIVSVLDHPRAVAIGVGEQTGIPATTPEGRFYSRRVDVIIRSNEPQ